MRKDDVDLALLQEVVRRILPSSVRWTVERTAGGISTQVYRLRRGATVYYLRVAEEREDSFAPDVRVHDTLRARGVAVPAVVYFEPFNQPLQRSLMVTSEIPGEPIGHRGVDATTAEVLRAAGRDLAVIAPIPVAGFGWIRRDRGHVSRLEAEQEDYRRFALEHCEEYLGVLGRQALTAAEITAIRTTVARHDAWLDVAQACLAHGDFDVSHIYQQEGRYTGIIDFGEMRGADTFYDLGHFNLHDGETLPMLLLPALLAGYGQAVALLPDHAQRINLVSLLIGVRALARGLALPSGPYQRHLAGALRRALAALNT